MSVVVPMQRLSAFEALQSAKTKIFGAISRISLRDVCYGTSIALGLMCVIHARKGKIITATTLAVFTEIAMFFAGTKPKEKSVEVKASLKDRISFVQKGEAIPSTVDLATEIAEIREVLSMSSSSPDDKPTKSKTMEKVEIVAVAMLTIISMLKP